LQKALQERWCGSKINRKGSETVNTKFSFQETQLKEALLITPFCAEDHRGAFIKDYSREVFQANGLRHDLAEVFYTVSQKGVVRGMHFQRERQQAKLVRCISGSIYDVIVDLRPESETFLKWQGFWLTGENLQMLYVPAYFAHGYLATEDFLQNLFDEYVCRIFFRLLLVHQEICSSSFLQCETHIQVLWRQPCLYTKNY